MVATWIYTATILTIAFTVTAAAGMQEICQWETFEARCQDDEVIMIKEAHYGRMGTGRCMPTNSGFIGCSADVTTIMHNHCSGRSNCTVPIPDPTMFAATPCPKDLVTYLQTDYECVKIVKSNSVNCDDQILTALKGNIAKPLTNSKQYNCPHRILAQPGQTVNVYLYDFYSKNNSHEVTPECITYGFVSEGGNPPTKVCGGKFKKNHLIYTSDKNIVDIMLTDVSSHSHHYLLHYDVVGCPKLNAPKTAFVKIQDNAAVITCNNSNIAFSLVCSNNKWVGEVENCTSIRAQLLAADAVSVASFSEIFANSGAFTIACVGIVSGILVGFGLLMITKARHLKFKQISELPQTYRGENLAPAPKEKPFQPVDQNQPVYMPIDSHDQYAPVYQNNIYETGPGSLSAHHLMVTDYATSLDSCIPITHQATYGPLRIDQKLPVYNYSHRIYDLAALSHTLGREKIISIEDDVLA